MVLFAPNPVSLFFNFLQQSQFKVHSLASFYRTIFSGDILGWKIWPPFAQNGTSCESRCLSFRQDDFTSDILHNRIR
jgi:hypothetical protein